MATVAAQGSVVSRDGTRIGFRRVGAGPALVLVQGAMGTEANYAELAAALADRFTVVTPDRRGRGMSPKPFDPGHVIARDVEDVEAVRAAAGAGFLFGLSSGAMIVLEAAWTLPDVRRAAVFEPPFYPNEIDRAAIARFGDEVTRDDLPSALVTAGRIVGLAPLPVRLLPRPVARLVTAAILRRDDRRDAGYAKLRDLIPAMRFDFHVVAQMDGRMSTMAAVTVPTLLLSGTRSPAYLQQAILSLAGVLQGAEHVTLAGLDHAGPWNRDLGGDPGKVAAALRGFFSDSRR